MNFFIEHAGFACPVTSQNWCKDSDDASNILLNTMQDQAFDDGDEANVVFLGRRYRFRLGRYGGNRCTTFLGSNRT